MEAHSAPEVSELSEVCDVFGRALIWAGRAESLVDMGWHMHALLAVMRPALLEGMELKFETDLARELVKFLGADRVLLERVGEHYRKALQCVRRCGALSQLGQRGFAMIYLIKPTAIGSLTNAALGSLNNRTRQAFNKTVQEMRDSLAGFRNEMMRSEETRKRCRTAQKSRS